MPIVVVPYSDAWPVSYARVAADLARALAGIPTRIEHVGSTAVPGLAAKPVLDIDVIVDADGVRNAIEALEAVGYTHQGERGIDGRHALAAPDDDPVRHVYVCVSDALAVRNHLAIREVLRSRPDLRDAYAAVKVALADDPAMDMTRYLAGKSAVLQRVLAESDLTAEERGAILRLNDPDAAGDVSATSPVP